MSALTLTQRARVRSLRAFVKEQGLDIKTSGPGRTKATIYEDIAKLYATSAPPAPAPAPPPSPPPAAAEPAAAAEAAVAVEEAAEAAEREEPPAATAPDGFEWGGTF